MKGKLHILVICAALVALSWTGYGWMARRFGNSPISPEVYISKLYPIRKLDRMDQGNRRTVVAEMGRQLRRVPRAERPAVYESDVFNQFYYDSCEHEDRIVFITYYLDEAERAVFQEFVNLPEEERVRLIRRAAAKLLDDPGFRNRFTPAQWALVEPILTSDYWLGHIAGNYDVFLFGQLPEGQNVSLVIDRLLDQLRGP